MSDVGISVLVLTKNEQQDLPGCLESVAWSDDVHVFDSFSDDRTVEIAEAAGARVTQRVFDNWSAHQNWGLCELPFKHRWVFYIDADERMTPELVDEIRSRVRAPGDKVAFRIRRRDHYMGRWLRHAAATPYYVRLFVPGNVHYERLINPVTVVDGPVGQLDAHFNHFPFSKGVSHWFARHNAYSTLEARQIVDNRRQQSHWSLRQALFASDPGVRRFHQKELFYRLPMRPLVKFALLYGLRRGFLDGYPGFSYAVLQAMYEYMIVLKTRELERGDAF